MMTMNDTITEAKIDRYLDITRRALEKLKVVTPDRSFKKRLMRKEPAPLA